jgi:8-oxo-dGTP diphosphatase
MNNSARSVLSAIDDIITFDELEYLHLQEVKNWINSGAPIFRISKPDNPPKHLVSYIVPYDAAANSILLTDHTKAHLWLPSGGHVEIDEDPKQTVLREAKEELGIEATFHPMFGNKPAFITVTPTIGYGEHTDVSLWYIVYGLKDQIINFDKREMNSTKWFGLDEILAMEINIFDPHTHRFVHKILSHTHNKQK